MSEDVIPAMILRTARELISDPEHWTKVVSARNASGLPVSVEDESATSWCSIGALRKATVMLYPEAFERLRMTEDDAYGALWSLSQGKGVACFNDTSTHEEVLALFDQAIKELESGK